MPSQKILDAKKKVVAALVADFKDAKSFVFAEGREADVRIWTVRKERNRLCYQLFVLLQCLSVSVPHKQNQK